MEENFTKMTEFVKEQLKDNDNSHDFSHIERVLKLSRFIAEKEGIIAPATPGDDPTIIVWLLSVSSIVPATHIKNAICAPINAHLIKFSHHIFHNFFV